MRFSLALFGLSFVIFVFGNGCQQSNNEKGPLPEGSSVCTPHSSVFHGTASAQSWSDTKAAQAPLNQLPSEYQNPELQVPLSNLAWEDGLYITRDGLTLYSYYTPMDYLKIVTVGATPDLFYKYERGNLIGQDFSNPLGQPHPWLHADVAVSHRLSVNESFCTWSLSNLKGQYTNLGAPAGILNATNSDRFDFFVYTDDSSGKGKIKLLKNVDRNLSADGTLLTANINEAAYNQDNPHIERYDSTDPNKLILFYASPDKPGQGAADIWFTISSDAGSTWTNPINVSAINTAVPEDQPHLYFDGSSWWLYYTTLNTADGKPGIFRVKQGIAGNWNSWQNKELVVSAGTSAGVGEPTLTSSGNLYFVVLTNNISGATPTDQFDSDPWIMKPK